MVVCQLAIRADRAFRSMWVSCRCSMTACPAIQLWLTWLPLQAYTSCDRDTSKTIAMVEERKKANKLTDEEKKAVMYCEKVKPYFEEIRYHCDKLELMIDDELWPLVKYREMLFTR